MQLFDAIENCFPEMEKQYQEICPPPEDFWPPVLVERARVHLLSPNLTALFVRAGVENQLAMASTLVEWFFYDRLSREDSGPAPG